MLSLGSLGTSAKTARGVKKYYDHWQGARRQFDDMNNESVSQNDNIPGLADTGAVVGFSEPSRETQRYIGKAFGELLAPGLGFVNDILDNPIYSRKEKMRAIVDSQSKSQAHKFRSSEYLHKHRIPSAVTSRDGIKMSSTRKNFMKKRQGKGKKKVQQGAGRGRKMTKVRSTAIVASNMLRAVRHKGKLPRNIRRNAFNNLSRGPRLKGRMVPATMTYTPQLGAKIGGRAHNGYVVPVSLWDSKISAYYQYAGTSNFLVFGGNVVDACNDYVLAPWWVFYNPLLLPTFGQNYMYYRIKEWKLRYVPQVNFNNSGEIMVVGVQDVAEVHNRGLAFASAASGRAAGGHTIVTSDIYGTSSGGIWGNGTDVTEFVKNWTGGAVKQRVPYDPFTVSLNFDKRWKRNVEPATTSNLLPLCYDTTEVIEILPNTSGMLCMWGTMNDSFAATAPDAFRRIGDVYLDITLEFKDLGSSLQDADIKLGALTSHQSLMQKRIDAAVLKALTEAGVPPPSNYVHSVHVPPSKPVVTEVKKLQVEYESDDEQPITSGRGSWHKVDGKLVQTPWDKEPGNPLYKADGTILDLEDAHLVMPKKKSSSVKSDRSTQSERKA